MKLALIYAFRESVPSFTCSCTLVSGSGITFAYRFLLSASGGSSSDFTVIIGIWLNSSFKASRSLLKFASPAKFTECEGPTWKVFWNLFTLYYHIFSWLKASCNTRLIYRNHQLFLMSTITVADLTPRILRVSIIGNILVMVKLK